MVAICRLCMIVGLAVVLGCSKTQKAVPLTPLPLDTRATMQAITLTEQGTTAYQSGQYPEAKALFEQAVSTAPDLGATHYNLALALNALGDTQAAHDQFLEAATLEPGDKIIWDSPALRPYGNPEGTKSSAVPTNPSRRGAMGGGYGSGSMGSPR
ncbi:hypothetical protein YTPLAS18_14310 [Nitrospira sp.]|nr:hypothetical protein YTPLAS18_14310 [Nitrospira sp.]